MNLLILWAWNFSKLCFHDQILSQKWIKIDQDKTFLHFFSRCRDHENFPMRLKKTKTCSLNAATFGCQLLLKYEAKRYLTLMLFFLSVVDNGLQKQSWMRLILILFTVDGLFHTRRVVLRKSPKRNTATRGALSCSNEGNGLSIHQVIEGVGSSQQVFE